MRSDLPGSDRLDAIVPLAVLQTLQALDRTDPIELQEYAKEVAPKRLGISATVAAQIERYERLVRRGKDVSVEDVRQLLRLVGRRRDAPLAFSQAGRLAARRAVERSSIGVRLVHRAAPGWTRGRAGFRLADRVARRAFGATMARDGNGRILAVVRVPVVQLEEDSVICGFFGAALAELLRCYTEFDGALEHSSCRARGDGECRWQSGGFAG